MAQKRAKIGGETGVNGEFYEGGKFLPSTERSKSKGSRPAKARKVQVEPYVWVTLEPEDNRKPLFSIVGTDAEYIDRYDWKKGIKPFISPNSRDGLTYSGYSLEDAQTLCDRFNAGERWI